MKNIIITGGELFNKGAQSMLFITICEVKKRFPNHEILVLSPMDLERPKEQKEIYSFRFIGWYPTKFAKCQNNPLMRLLYLVRHFEELRECESIYRNCDMLIDISGYALGSNWGTACCNVYLEHLEFATAFNIPFYLMPQSFGPFNFSEKDEIQIHKRIENILPNAKVICAREKEGCEALLQTYGLKNVHMAEDLVLNNKEIDLSAIYKTVPIIDLPEIEKNSVGIIPNGQTILVNDKRYVLDLYKTVIKELLDRKKHIYLLSHATADSILCKEIKDMFSENENVIFLNKDFSCFEFNGIVSQFEFVIASRFHSIVHAYKNKIPCISIGWAIKYYELLLKFEQDQYAFDIRENIDIDCFLKAIRHMDDNRSLEVLKIDKHLNEIQKKNVFDILSL